MNKSRLEAFSDGVLAIIITIMVLEIKVPEGTDWASLKPLVPVFFSYIISFVFVGIYWGNHHHLLHTVKSVNSRIMWSNINLLFWLSLIPFASGWMGENHFAANTVMLYAVILLLSGVSFVILGVVVERCNPHPPEVLEAFSRGRAKGIISIVCYAAAIPLAMVNTGICAALFIIVSVMWLIPDKNIERALKQKPE